MKKELIEILDSIPTEVNHSDIIDFKDFDERMSAVGVLYANTIGVSSSHIEFYPDNEPPLKEEILSWIWSFRPDLTDDILKMDLSEDFTFLIESYRDSEMDKFWKEWS